MGIPPVGLKMINNTIINNRNEDAKLHYTLMHCMYVNLMVVVVYYTSCELIIISDILVIGKFVVSLTLK